MSNSLLTLGPFSFNGLESPDKILLSRRQRIVIHHLGSGLSEVDFLGNDFESVTFQGIFSGTDTAVRIGSIDYLRRQGNPLFLTWGTTALLVIIRDFDLSYVSNRWVPYRLSCLVVTPSLDGPGNPSDVLSMSADQQVADLLNLLRINDISPTSDQTTALVDLATENYDLAPHDALQNAQQLLGVINSQLAVQSPTSTNTGGEALASSDYTPIQLANIVDSAGQQANLILARNRLMGIIIAAQAVNQQ